MFHVNFITIYIFIFSLLDFFSPVLTGGYYYYYYYYYWWWWWCCCLSLLAVFFILTIWLWHDYYILIFIIIAIINIIINCLSSPPFPLYLYLLFFILPRIYQYCIYILLSSLVWSSLLPLFKFETRRRFWITGSRQWYERKGLCWKSANYEYRLISTYIMPNEAVKINSPPVSIVYQLKEAMLLLGEGNPDRLLAVMNTVMKNGYAQWTRWI